MRIERVVDPETLLAWRYELDRCLKSDYPNQSYYPPGIPDAGVPASHIESHLRSGAGGGCVALWCEGGAYWANVGADLLTPGRTSCFECVLRVRERGAFRALRDAGVEHARRVGANDYFAYVCDHATPPGGVEKAPRLMSEWGAESWARVWRKDLGDG